MFHLSYILGEHGWATARFGDGHAEIQTSVSNLSDALGDMARAARYILKGATDASFSFMDEPGEHRFLISRREDRVEIRVYEFPEPFARTMNNAPIVLKAEASLRAFTNECINVLRHVLDAHGEAGYRERWKRHAFPMAEYRELLDLRRNTLGERQMPP